MTARLVPLLLVAGLLAGCTGDGDGKPDQDEKPSAETVATALATGLSSGSLTRVPFDAATAQIAQTDYDEIVAGMGEVHPTVEMTTVAEDDDGTARATLDWTWPLGDEEWSYRTFADLTEGTDEWQVTWSDDIVEQTLSDPEVLTLGSATPDRGDILGANGLALVTERPVSRVGIDKPTVAGSEAGASARALAKIVGIDPKDYAKRVEAAGPKAFVEAIVFRQEELTPATLRAVQGIDGARVIGGFLPLAPYRDFALPILGRVGEVTA